MVHQTVLDTTFAAIADPTRRAVLERLRAGPATISELAEPFSITLTGMKKHVGVLEAAGLVATHKVGRARVCELGPRRLDDAAAWIDQWRRDTADRLDRLAQVVQRQKEQRG